MKRSYFDWAAGAPILPEAKEAALAAMELGSSGGNPSSIHAQGRAARALLEEARGQVAELAGCHPREVIFTSSATEANAAVVFGASRPGERLLLSAVEHPSLRYAAAQAKSAGVVVEEIPVDASGRAKLDAIGEGPAALLCLQLVNNETGVIQPVAEAAARATMAGAHFHCDAVQGAGKLSLEDVVARCHSVAISSHKLGGLPGAAALILRRGVELLPLLPGSQERGQRGGTPALPAIAAFGAVARAAMQAKEERLASLRRRTEELERLVREVEPRAILRGADAPRVPGIVSVTFPGVDGETLLVSLDLVGVSASLGAACSTGALEPSHVLRAMGLSAEEARATLRFSLGPTTSDEDLRRLREALSASLPSSRLD